MKGKGMWVVIRFGISPRCANSLPWSSFWSDWRRRRKVWVTLRYLSGWCPKVLCRMSELIGGSLTMWGAEAWATSVIRLKGRILRDTRTLFFNDISRLASVETQVNERLLRKALSILLATMKVPFWIIMLDEPLNIVAQQSRNLGGRNRAWPGPAQGSENKWKSWRRFNCLLYHSMPRDCLLPKKTISAREYRPTDLIIS